MQFIPNRALSLPVQRLRKRTRAQATDEVKRCLRMMKHPITLFGENDPDQRDRLLLSQHEHNDWNIEDEFRLGSSSGRQRHDGKYSAAVEKEHAEGDEEDEDYFDDDDNGVKKGGSSSSSRTVSRASKGSVTTATTTRGGVGSVGHHHGQESSSSAHAEADNDDDSDNEGPNTTRGDDGETNNKGGSKHLSGFDVNGKRIEFSKIIPRLSPEKIVYKYFRSLLKEWEWDLNKRDDSEKMSTKGKTETKLQKQCKDYIRPLFKLCKRKDVEVDILERLIKIAVYIDYNLSMKLAIVSPSIVFNSCKMFMYWRYNILV